MTILIPFGVILLLILVNGLFVSAEFAIIGVRPSRMEQLAQEGSGTADRIVHILQNPTRMDRWIASSQLGITLASLGLGMYGEPAIAHLLETPLHDWLGLSDDLMHTVSFVIGLLGITYLHVVAGEMVPKSLALHNAESTVLFLARPMRVMQRILNPAITFLNKIGFLVLHLLRIRPPEEGSRLHTPEDLELIVSDSFVEGLVEEQEQQLIANIFDFAERRVSQVMTPRKRIQAIPITISEEDLLKIIFDSTHTRFPVYESTINNVIGILHLKDLVRQQTDGRPFVLRSLLHEAPVVSSNALAETALASLRQIHIHMAVVVDEERRTVGLITLEDLLEEVVGEVMDEFDDDEEEFVHQVEPGHLTAQGNASLSDIEAYVPIGEHRHDIRTIGGLALALLNHPPNVGDIITFNGIELRIDQVDGLTIEQVTLRFEHPSSESKSAATPDATTDTTSETNADTR